MIEKIRELREFEDYSMREVANNIGVAKTTGCIINSVGRQ